MEDNVVYNSNKMNNAILSYNYKHHLFIKMLLNSQNVKENFQKYNITQDSYSYNDLYKTLYYYLKYEHITKRQKDNSYHILECLSECISLDEMNELKVFTNKIKTVDEKNFIGKEAISHFCAKSSYKVCTSKEKLLIDDCLLDLNFYTDFFAEQTIVDYELWNYVVAYIYEGIEFPFEYFCICDVVFNSINQYIAEVGELIDEESYNEIIKKLLMYNNSVLKLKEIKDELNLIERIAFKRENNKCLKKLKTKVYL